jgi:hypothetical protein
MAFIPIRTYKIVTSGTHSTIAIDTSLLQRSRNCWQVRIETKTVDAAVLFGASASIAADTTITSNVLVAGTHYLAGTVELTKLPIDTTHVSAEGFAAGPGEVWITIGYGEAI